jgi:dipeptidyl aminopeptidase/acylaminoacyl peptidase
VNDVLRFLLRSIGRTVHYVDSDIYVSFGLTAALLVGWAVPLRAQERELRREKRAVTVRDAISMTRLGLPENVLSGPVPDAGAKFSPDGKRVLIVLKKGNLDQNTNDYSVVLYDTAKLLQSPEPKVLVTLSSSSNREGVKDIKWLADSETFAFIGEKSGEQPQIYEFNIAKDLLERVTNHTASVVAFDVSDDGKTILLEADPPPQQTSNVDTRRSVGIAITNESLTEILANGCTGYIPTATQGEQLFLIRNGEGETAIPLDDVLYAQYLRPSLSRDGRYGVFGVFVREVPSSWSEYKERWLKESIRQSRRKGEAATAVARYMLLNTNNRDVRPLLNSPISSFPNKSIAWAPDGNSVVVSGVHLPLDGVADTGKKEARREKTYVVEVKLPGNAINEITDEELRIKAWSPSPSRLQLTQERWSERAKEITFEKQGGLWTEVPPTSSSEAGNDRPTLAVVEDLNSPPKIYARSPKTGENVILLDLNPGFSGLSFSNAEEVTWKATDGHDVQGGLFLPSNYKRGERYPLVIQTHGFITGKFYMDGPWSSGFAVQSLASKGFVVLQVGYSVKHDDDDPQFVNTPNEAPRQMAVFEGAIQYLDSRGLIDLNRIGIIGFSRTVYTVAYTLTHSNYRFAAATFADGITGGYFEYLTFPLLSTPLLYGGPPFGPTLSQWVKDSPSFNLDKLHTPLRIEAYGPDSVLGFWDWFSGLTLLKKPVDFIYLPDAPHLLSKPAERLISQQGDVEWFCFWLKGEEDPGPTKAEQYKRWRELRKLQEQNEKKSANAASPSSK